MDKTLTRKEPSALWVVAAFAAIYLIWGSTYLAIMIAIRDIPPLLMAGIRFLIAGVLLYFFARFRGESTPGWRSFGSISLAGILMLFLGTGAVVWSEQYLSSGLTAIIVATVPLWFVLLDKRQWRFNFSNKWIIAGLLIGFIGVLLLFADKRTFGFAGDKWKIISFFVLTGGSIAWAIGSLQAKYRTVEGSTVMKAAIQMIAAGSCSVLAGLLGGEHHRLVWSAVSQDSVLALLYLIIIGSLVGYMAYVWLLSVRSPALVGTYAYVNPVVAVFLGWLIIGEVISGQQVIALAVILAGVILVTLSKELKRGTDRGKAIQ